VIDKYRNRVEYGLGNIWKDYIKKFNALLDEKSKWLALNGESAG
jgi:hypothetical protein